MGKGYIGAVKKRIRLFFILKQKSRSALHREIKRPKFIFGELLRDKAFQRSFQDKKRYILKESGLSDQAGFL